MLQPTHFTHEQAIHAETKLTITLRTHLVILIVFGAVIVVRVVGILEATIVLVEMGKVQFLFPSTVC